MGEVIALKAVPTGEPNKFELARLVDGDTFPLANLPSPTAQGAATVADFLAFKALRDNPHQVTAVQAGAIPVGEKGAPNGVAALDASGKVPSTQIPATQLPSVHVVADAAERLGFPNLIEGDEAIQLDDGSQWLWDGSAWHPRPQSEIVYGAYYKQVESLDPSSTTDDEWETKLSLTTEVLPSGLYKLQVAYGWNHNDSSSDFMGRVVEDGTRQLGQLHFQEPQDTSGSWENTGTNQRQYINRVFYLPISGQHSYTLEYASSDSGEESSIWDSSMEFKRVALA